VLADIAHAGECLERCVEALDRPDYDIVGLSCTFDTQVPAAIAIAKGIKARRPEVRVILGGAACLEQQADGLVASFPALDAVCHSEGEEVIVPLVQALRAGRDLAGVPGIAFRDSAGAVRHTPSPPLNQDLDSLPMPDYRHYRAQLAASVWAGSRPRLFFETSRGCWWGEKHLCTFCGINGEGLAFRSKSADRAYREIMTLYRDYPEARLLQATDNIIDIQYLTKVLPRLVATEWEPERPLRMFYEVKTNLRREQVHLLVRGGVIAVQPGVESFSDEVLALMDKGCTGLGQVQFIKWAAEAGLEVYYNIIVGNPGDQAEWYDYMTALVDVIDHLPPPRCVTPLMLERFSPYFNDPAAHGMENVRPRAAYHEIYRDPAADLERIAYVFDFDHPVRRDQAVLAAQRRLIARVQRWAAGWKPGQVAYQVVGGRGLVTDGRGGRLRSDVLTGVARELFDYLYKTRPLDGIVRRFSHVDPGFLMHTLALWRERRWLAADPNEHYLVVIPRYDSPEASPVAAEKVRAIHA